MEDDRQARAGGSCVELGTLRAVARQLELYTSRASRGACFDQVQEALLFDHAGDGDNQAWLPGRGPGRRKRWRSTLLGTTRQRPEPSRMDVR